MTEAILEAINLSFVADSETLKVATQTLLEFQKQPGSS